MGKDFENKLNVEGFDRFEVWSVIGSSVWVWQRLYKVLIGGKICFRNVVHCFNLCFSVNGWYIDTRPNWGRMYVLYANLGNNMFEFNCQHVAW